MHSLSNGGRSYGCPVEFALNMIGGKWKTVILARIKERPMRYSELRRTIPLSEKMLSQRLRELHESGFVSVEVSADGSEHYALTRSGHDLAPVLQALYEWGVSHGREVDVKFHSSPLLPT